MRIWSAIPCIVAVLALLAPSIASAQGVQAFGGGRINKNGSPSTDDEDRDEVDAATKYAQEKAWSASTSFETNRALRTEDVGAKGFTTLSLFAGYRLTKADRVSVSGGFMQRYVADPTETGIRADDIGLSYSHWFQLPGKVLLMPRVSNSIPISFRSRMMSLIALPSAGLGLSRNFLDGNLNLNLNGSAAYYIVEYKTPVGRESSNPRASTSFRAGFSYSMPFHQNLQVSAGAGTSFSWDHNVDHSNDATLREQFRNTPVEPSADPYFPGAPPRQQSYSWDASVSYQIPSPWGVQTYIQAQISQGDGVYRDGATHLYWLSRRGSTASAQLSITY